MIAGNVENVNLDIKGVQDTIGPDLQWRNQISTYLVTGVGGFGILIGIGLTILIVRTFRQMTASIDDARLSAESSAQTKADFLANMSHEIRTPMNAIIGMAHLALRTDLDRKQHDYLTKIHGSGQHLLGIINDILDFSKIEAGKLTVEEIDFRIEEVLDNVAGLIGERASAKGLELIFDVDPSMPDRLMGDPLRIGQILVNYSNNAVKFTESGDIRIKVGAQDETESHLTVRFEVEDTGIGMTDEQKSRLFQSFSQADTSTTRQYGGTGLGLAISKHLSELMGGTVGVSTELGSGSNFWFTARLRRGNSVARSFLPEPDLRDRHVLVVDDNPHAREILSTMLNGMTFRADVVSSGEEAVSAVREANASDDPYEIVFLDWKMDGIDGIEAGRQITALDVPNTPELVMVTAYGRAELVEEAEKAGIKVTLVKPVTQSHLFDAAVSVLGGEAPDQLKQREDWVDHISEIRGASILLVEDNELNQQVAIELLREAGLEVDLAVNGLEAVQMVKNAEYDAVLMDMQMPVMDGVTATQEIKKDPQFESLPIIAMTANAMETDREKTREAGMVEHIAKPIDPMTLFSALLHFIEGKDGERPATDSAEAPVETSSNTDELTIPGVDVQGALRRVLGKKDVYVRLLRQFVDGEEAQTPARIRELIPDDRETAERVAHSLKGVAGTIGADSVQSTASDLEGGIRENQPVDELLDQLEGEITTLIENITAALPQDNEQDSVTEELDVNWDDVRALLDRIYGRLDANDTEALDIFNESDPLLRAALIDLHGAARTHVDAWDLEGLRSVLDKARQDIPQLSPDRPTDLSAAD